MRPTTFLLTVLVALLPLVAYSRLNLVNVKGAIEALKHNRQAGGTTPVSKSSGLFKINRRSPAVAAKPAPKKAAAKKTPPKPKPKGTPKAGAKKGAPANTKGKAKGKGVVVKGNKGTAKGAAASCPMPQKGGKKGKLGKRADCGGTTAEQEESSGKYVLATLCPGGKGKRSLTKRTPVGIVNEKDVFCVVGGGNRRFSGKLIREAAVRGRDQWVADLPALQRWRREVLDPARVVAREKRIGPQDDRWPKDYRSGTRLDHYPKRFGNKVGGKGPDRNQEVISQDEIKKCSDITVNRWNKDWYFIEYPIFPTGAVYDAQVDPRMKPESDRVLCAFVPQTRKIVGVWLITHLDKEDNAVRVGMRHPEKRV